MKIVTPWGVAALVLLAACGGTRGGTGEGTGGGGMGGGGGSDPEGTGGNDVQECHQEAGISPAPGSGCTTVGATCDIACSACQMLCAPDLTWQQICATLGCPDSAPQNGDACDPCSSPSACTYDLGAECNHKTATAACSVDHWEVTTPTCP